MSQLTKLVYPLRQHSGYYGQGYGINGAKSCILAMSRDLIWHLENIVLWRCIFKIFNNKKCKKNFNRAQSNSRQFHSQGEQCRQSLIMMPGSQISLVLLSLYCSTLSFKCDLTISLFCLVGIRCCAV